MRTPEQLETMTWKEFMEFVIQKYFPLSYCDRRKIEFLELKQRGMSEIEYKKKFTQLSRFATHLVDTEVKKARRFQRGLRPEITTILAGHETLMDVEVVEIALKIVNRMRLDKANRKNTDGL